MKLQNNTDTIFISYDYPPLAGGISRLCVAVVDLLKEKNTTVSVITTKQKYSNILDDCFCSPSVFTIRVPRKRVFRELFTYLYLLFRVNNKKDRLVVTGLWYPEALLCVLSGFRKLVIFVHGNEVMENGRGVKGFILKRLRKFVFRHAQLIIANSNYTANLARVIVPTGKIISIPLGVDHVRFHSVADNLLLRKKFCIPEDKIVILTVARIQPNKGHDVILKALSLLNGVEKKAFYYLVIGKGDYLEALKSMAKNLNIENIVKWLGFISEEDLPNYYRLSDIFVLCTREEKYLQEVEGFGLVFLEAQASGIMTIGTNQGGIPDAIEHGNGGFLIDRNDYLQLANYLRGFIRNPNGLAEQGRLARKRVENGCTWHHFGEKFYNALKNENLVNGL